MKTNQKGFNIVEILIVIVVVGLLGAVGWIAYGHQNKKNGETPVPTATEAPKKQPEAPKSSEYKNEELGLSLSYPAQWGRATLKQGPFSEVQGGDYKQLNFSKAAKVSINFVMAAYRSPLDACGLEHAVKNAQHRQHANQASLIGWEADAIKRYFMKPDGSSAFVYKQAKTSYREVSRKDKVLVYQDIREPIKAGTDGCYPITQAEADEANAFAKFFHYAVNYSNKMVYGVNAQFDARQGDDAAVRAQLTDALNTLK